MAKLTNVDNGSQSDGDDRLWYASAAEVQLQWAGDRGPRTKDEDEKVAMSWRQANNSWRLDEGSSWRSGVGWSGEYENRMTDHDKRCLTSFNNHWQLQFAVWRRPGDICANTEIIIMTDCRQSSTRMEVLLGPSWPTCAVSCDRSGIKWPKVRHIDPRDPVFAVHIGNYHVEIPTDSWTILRNRTDDSVDGYVTFGPKQISLIAR